jgi:hypothetical protein
MMSSIDRLADGFERHVRRVLGRQHDRVDAVRLAVDVADGDLAFGVRTQPRQTAVLAQMGLTLDQTVRQVDRKRHQHRRFVAGVAEHEALVAGALIQVIVAGAVDALRDVRALLVVGDQHGAALVVDAVFGVVVADALDCIARDMDVVDVGGRRDFTRQHHQAGVAERFGGDAGGRILRQDGVEDGIRNLVGHLVRVAFRYRFRGE